jgi:N-acetylmuramoyl-L-alanine amidase
MTDMAQLGPDGLHEIPADRWDEINAAADLVAQATANPELEVTGDQAAMLSQTVPAPLAMLTETKAGAAIRIPDPVTGFIPAVNHGGAMGHSPTLLVVHDAESPLRVGYARSIAANWFGKAQPPGRESSAHYIVDPADCIQMVHTYDIAWAVGPHANGFTLNYEQAGYAKFTAAEWETVDGKRQMSRLAAILATDAQFYGIPIKWATDADIKAAAAGVKGGICTHRDITRVLAGTTHDDPGEHYPRADLMLMIRSLLTPAPAPAPPKKSPELVSVSGRVPILHFGDRDPIAVGGGMYVHRVQQILGTPVTGVYDDALRAAVAATNARLLSRRTDGKTVDALFWHRIYGLV